MTDVSARLAGIRHRIDEVAAASARTDQVALVAVTKTVPASKIDTVYQAGQRLFGENRVQEAAAKIEGLGSRMADARWHLIGHLQTNKVRSAVQEFDLIESVDSVPLAMRLDSEAARVGRRVPVLLEVNVAGEASKSGFRANEIGDSVKRLIELPWLEARGLMTIAPLSDDPESVRWVFRELRELRNSVQQRFGLPGFRELSMGMSNDFEVAIQEGATIVRLGRAIFGERPN